MRHRMLALAGHGKFPAGGRVPANARLDRASQWIHVPLHQRMVGFRHGAFLKRPLEHGIAAFGGGHHHHA